MTPDSATRVPPAYPVSHSTRFDNGLEHLLSFSPTYAGGLSNHGPMALEALTSLGAPDLYEAFLHDYTPRLERTDHEYPPVADTGRWPWELRTRLPSLVARAGAQAGHGLLRVAHAVRSLERVDTEVRRRELSAALEYWNSGVTLPAPDRLAGSRPLVEVVARLPRLSPGERREGLLTRNLMVAARRDDVVELLASIAPAQSIPDRFDDLALAAAQAFVHNRGAEAFALLHGVTVTTMARVLIEYLDESDRRRLEAAVTGFSVAAIVGFDLRGGSPMDASMPENRGDLPVQDLARSVASVLDDHHIKFADACAGLAHRRPEVEPLVRAMLAARLAG